MVSAVSLVIISIHLPSIIVMLPAMRPEAALSAVLSAGIPLLSLIPIIQGLPIPVPAPMNPPVRASSIILHSRFIQRALPGILAELGSPQATILCFCSRLMSGPVLPAPAGLLPVIGARTWCLLRQAMSCLTLAMRITPPLIVYSGEALPILSSLPAIPAPSLKARA